MTESPASTVVVVGMGPVGMTAALGLGRQGITVTVLEACDDLATESRASTFHPPSLEILRDLGVVDELIELGLQAPGFQYRGHDRELIAHLDLAVLADDTEFPYRLQCEQSKLTRIIRGRLEKMPNVTLRFGAPVRRVEVGTDAARVYLDGDEFEPSYTADWLLGADGANSAVRRSLGIAFEGVTYPERFLVASTTHDFSVDIPGLAPVSYVYDPDDWGVLLRTPSHWRALFPISPDTASEQALDPDFVQARLQGLVPLAADYEVIHSTIYAVHQRVAATFGVGRVLLLGDAAHINNPLGGMGMNSGIHDTRAAVQAVMYAVAGGDPARAVETYSQVRRDAARLDVQQSTHKNYEEMRQTDDRLRQTRRGEMVDIAADARRARAYLRVTSMLASFQTSDRRMRRRLTPVIPPLTPPGGRRLSDMLRDWGLPGTPAQGYVQATAVPLAGVVPVAGNSTSAGKSPRPRSLPSTDDLSAAVAQYPVAVVTDVPDDADLAELVARCERAGVAAVMLAGPARVETAARCRRDLLVIAVLDLSQQRVPKAADAVAELAAARADMIAVRGTHDPAELAALHQAASRLPLVVSAEAGQDIDRLALLLAGAGLVLVCPAPSPSDSQAA